MQNRCTKFRVAIRVVTVAEEKVSAPVLETGVAGPCQATPDSESGVGYISHFSTNLAVILTKFIIISK